MIIHQAQLAPALLIPVRQVRTVQHLMTMIHQVRMRLPQVTAHLIVPIVLQMTLQAKVNQVLQVHRMIVHQLR